MITTYLRIKDKLKYSKDEAILEIAEVLDEVTDSVEELKKEMVKNEKG